MGTKRVQCLLYSYTDLNLNKRGEKTLSELLNSFADYRRLHQTELDQTVPLYAGAI